MLCIYIHNPLNPPVHNRCTEPVEWSKIGSRVVVHRASRVNNPLKDRQCTIDATSQYSLHRGGAIDRALICSNKMIALPHYY